MLQKWGGVSPVLRGEQDVQVNLDIIIITYTDYASMQCQQQQLCLWWTIGGTATLMMMCMSIYLCSSPLFQPLTLTVKRCTLEGGHWQRTISQYLTTYSAKHFLCTYVREGLVDPFLPFNLMCDMSHVGIVCRRRRPINMQLVQPIASVLHSCQR